MSKNLSTAFLLDFYGELLTDKQQAALDLYYNQDLSLSEMVEEMSISRQGVRDFIKRGEAQLCEFEEKLGLAARFEHITQLVDEALEILDNADSPDLEKLQIRKKLSEIKNDL